MDRLHFQSGYRYSDSYSMEEFFNKALIYLKDDEFCPPYIFDEAKFSNVSKIDIPIIKAKGIASINYSRILGYDKQVTYTIETKIKKPDGSTQRKYSNSFKTETKWVKDSGVINGVSEASFVDPKYIDFINSLNLDETSLVKIDNKELNSFIIDDVVLEQLKNNILNNVYKDNITYPVNKIKKEEYSGEVEINNLSVTIISLYALEVNVRDSSFVLYASTNGSSTIYKLGNYPINDDQEDYNKRIYNISSERNSITKLPRTIRLLSVILLTALFLTLLIIGISKNILALTIVSFIPLILEIVIVIILNKKIRKVVLEYGEKINNITNERSKLINEERIDGYNRYINKEIDYKQKKVQ